MGIGYAAVRLIGESYGLYAYFLGGVVVGCGHFNLGCIVNVKRLVRCAAAELGNELHAGEIKRVAQLHLSGQGANDAVGVSILRQGHGNGGGDGVIVLVGREGERQLNLFADVRGGKAGLDGEHEVLAVYLGIAVKNFVQSGCNAPLTAYVVGSKLQIAQRAGLRAGKHECNAVFLIDRAHAGLVNNKFNGVGSQGIVLAALIGQLGGHFISIRVNGKRIAASIGQGIERFAAISLNAVIGNAAYFMRLAIVGNGVGRGERDVQIGLIYLAVSLVGDFEVVVIRIITGNSVEHGYFHGIASVSIGINALRGNNLHIVVCDNAERAHGDLRVVGNAIVGLVGNGSRYGHGLCGNVGRKLNGGFFQVVVVLVRTGEGYGRGILNGLVRADILIIELKREAGLIEANIRTFYHAVKLSVGAVNHGIGFAVIHLGLCLEACYGNFLLIYYKLRGCAADVVIILIFNGNVIFACIARRGNVNTVLCIGNGQVARFNVLAVDLGFAQVNALRFAVEGHGGIGYAGNFSSLLLRNLYGEINGYFADILCLNGNGSLVCAFLIGFDVLRLYFYFQTAVACKRAGYGFKRKVSVTVNGSGYARKLARAYILYCTCQAFGQRSANANSLDNLAGIYNFPRIGVESPYGTVDCRGGVIVQAARLTGEHIIGSRRFKAGNGAGQFSALLPLAFSGGSLSSADYIFLFGNNVQLKAIGSCIRGGRHGRRSLLSPCYGERCVRPGLAVFRSFAGGKRYLNFICTCFGRSRFKLVIQAVEIFNSPIHAYNFFRADFRRLLCAVIGEVEDVEVYNNGFLLLKHSLYRHVRAAHGEDYRVSLRFCFRQGYTGNFPLDELVVKVAWFGGKGDLVAFARILGRALNLAVAFYGNGQFIRSLDDGNRIALSFITLFVSSGFGIASLNIICHAVLHGELGFLAEILTGASTNKKIYRIVVNIFNGYDVLFGFDNGLVGGILRGFFDLRSRCFLHAIKVVRVANPNSEYLAYVVLGNSICICCTDRLSSAFTIPNVLYLLGIAFFICRGESYAVNGISGNGDLAGQGSLFNGYFLGSGLAFIGCGYGCFAFANGGYKAVFNGSNLIVACTPSNVAHVGVGLCRVGRLRLNGQLSGVADSGYAVSALDGYSGYGDNRLSYGNNLIFRICKRKVNVIISTTYSNLSANYGIAFDIRICLKCQRQERKLIGYCFCICRSKLNYTCYVSINVCAG